MKSFAINIIDRVIARWCLAIKNTLINSNDEPNTHRYHFLWPDEYWSDEHGLVNARPWYLPFNVFLHNWIKSDDGLLHDHPRWSITIVLKGCLIEETPTKYKWLKPGAVVFRSRKYVHRIIVPKTHEGSVWTLFIVGRRRFKQSYYSKSGELKKAYTGGGVTVGEDDAA
ncbi:hypothetical protein [Microbulbifer sp. TYP-18]|uniref:hypothetical protein n=1 Tax=Microbulbifer sp. TYP-18 TaxID=3230024 RepID=UPI0034C6B9E3